MRILKSVVPILFLAAAFAQKPQTVGSESHTWTGTLLDAVKTNCGAEVEHAVSPGTCPVSMRTASFGFHMPDGSFVRFDEGGNAKALEALRKSRKGSRIVFDYWRTGKTSTAVTARVTGALTSDTLNVESIRIE